jgi:dTDP-4-amino-4,6-dideoxygalactose transaminase
MKTLVTQPFLPPLEEFLPYLEKIWSSKWLTNNGPFHEQLEYELCRYLEVPYVSLFSNATLGLLTAMQALDIQGGEVITTPFSFVATSHALTWNDNVPVFVDIDPVTGNLNPALLEAAITNKTKAILPVHVYGTPCNTLAIQEIADKHKLPVIYDAAHCFGVKNSGKSILLEGNISIVSFHATKVFNTFEGGAIICHTAEMKQRIDDLKNFGFRDEVTVIASGINAKMNEFQAAFGLVQLKHIDTVLKKRLEICHYYRKELSKVKGVRYLEPDNETIENGAYFPIFIGEDYPLSRDELYYGMQKNEIYGRRYFFPLISNFELYSKLPSAQSNNLPIANQLADEVICLPLYPDLAFETIDKIINLIRISGEKK